ncbi:MAG: membrane protein insertase YidC [Spirochaetia bacterium]
MDKKTVIAVVLLSVLFTVFLSVGQYKSPAELPNEQEQATLGEAVIVSDALEAPLSPVQNTLAQNGTIQTYNVETDLFKVEFSSLGASITSLELKDYQNKGQPVEMIQRGGNPEWGAFLLYFAKDNSTNPFYGPYVFAEKTDYTYEFRANANAVVEGKEVPFVVIKTYRFVPDEYMFELRLSFVQPDGEYLPLNFGGFSYALESGPQIGPAFEKLDAQQNYRRPAYFNGKKSRNVKIGPKATVLSERVTWAAIDGKYFSLIGIPDESAYSQIFSARPLKGELEGIKDGTQLSFVRSQIRSSRQEDVFYFYVGPKQAQELRRYDNAGQNSFGLSNLKLESIAPDMAVFGWLERIFKVSLQFIHRYVPNWGWAIVILTIIVKVLLFPLSLKSMLSTARMADLQPKIKHIQDRYKDDPAELQKAQFELYRKEGINPMAGCLPLLLQLPIFIALYNLFNKFFELHGAPFFGWITDLSSPDVILQFSNPLPFVGWTGLHMLPIIYLVSQLLMNKVTQADSAAQTSQMKTIMLIMPLMFFFIFYGVASALLVYWIMSNMLSIIQQLIISHLKRTGHFQQAIASKKKK